LIADKALYLLFTQGLLETGTLVEPVKVFETGQATYVYNPAIYSPLYSFLCAPFLWLTNSFFATQFIVSFLSWVLFFTALYKLTLLLFKEYWQVSLFLLFATFFLYCHEFASMPKDTLAMGFTLWAVIVMHRFLQSHANWKTTCLLAVLFSCMCLVKLLYIPLAVTLLSTLFLFTGFKKSTAHFLQAGLLLSLTALLFFLTYYFVIRPAQHLGLAHSVRLVSDASPVVQGFYPRNLSVVFPFVSAAFLDLTFWGVQIEKMTSVYFGTVMNVFRKADIVLSAAIIFFVLFYYRRLIQNRLLLLLSAASLTMIIVVAYLTVTEKLVYYPHNMGLWSFGVDARSFLLPMLTLQLMAFLFVFNSTKFAILKYGLFLLGFLAFAHGIYFVAKTAVSGSWQPEAAANTTTFKAIGKLLSDSSAGSENKPVLVTPNNLLRRYAQVHSLPVLAFTNLETQPTWIKKGSRLFVAIYPEDSARLKMVPVQTFVRCDTIPPFVVYRYKAE
jgi:hypothetical protein